MTPHRDVRQDGCNPPVPFQDVDVGWVVEHSGTQPTITIRFRWVALPDPPTEDWRRALSPGPSIPSRLDLDTVSRLGDQDDHRVSVHPVGVKDRNLRGCPASRMSWGEERAVSTILRQARPEGDAGTLKSSGHSPLFMAT